MSPQTGFYMDTSKFVKSFNKFVTKTVPAAAAQAEFKVGSLIVKYALTKTPKVPREIGDLQASSVISVNKQTLTLTVGFNKIYAARLHEAPSNWNWSLPGSGPKYLETKLVMYKDDFIKFMAKLIGESFSNA